MIRNDQPDLFGARPVKPEASRALARLTDPETSHAAAASIDDALPHLEATVLTAFKARGAVGANLDEIVDATGLDKVTASPRMRPLCKKGLIAEKRGPDGKIVKRPGESGRNQTVWIAK